MLLLVHALIEQLFQMSCRGSELHSRTFKERAYLPDSQWPEAGELAKRQLHEEDGDATDSQHDEVRNQEGPCEKQEKKTNPQNTQSKE